MSSSTESLLDHIADFLKFISSTQSYWFSLNKSYDHGGHLANPEEYVALLIVAGLVSSSHRASWLSHQLLSSTHCVALSSSCRASWLLHRLSPSSSCTTLSSTHRASLLSHQLSLSSCCAALSLRRLVVVPAGCCTGWLLCRPFFVSSSSSCCPLVVLSSCHALLSSSRHAS